MRWLITGSGGQLGRCLVDSVTARKNQHLAGALDHAEFDIAKPGALKKLMRSGTAGEPNIVVNAAAFTAVEHAQRRLDRLAHIRALRRDVRAVFPRGGDTAFEVGAHAGLRLQFRSAR